MAVQPIGLFVAPLSLALLVSTAAAQTIGDATGTIEGRVTDRTGGVLADVVVRASSFVLMGTRTTVSRRDGSYLLAGLPPGEYALTFTLGSFQPATRRGVTVGLGATTSLSIVLAVAPAQAEVTVEGDTRWLDRHSTSIAAAFNRDQLASLPGSRSAGTLVAVAPSVLLTRFDVGGNRAFDSGAFSAYGTTGFNNPTLEGISITRFNAFGLILDYGSFDEAWVGLGAYGPEWPSPGAHVQVVTKSGGNQYRGSAYSGYEHRTWQTHNIDSGQIARGGGLLTADSNRLEDYHDFNADIGGFVRRDRVWWYASGRDQGVSSKQASFPAGPLEIRAGTVTGKATVRASDDHRFIVFALHGWTDQPVRLDGFLRAAPINQSEDSTTDQATRGTVWKAEWNGGLKGRFFVDARVGQFVVRRAETPKSSAPRFEDIVDLEVSGGNRDWNERLRRDQINGSLSYVGDGRFRNHWIRAGAEFERMAATETWRRAFAGDVLHVLRGGVPDDVYLFQTPSSSTSGLWWYSVFAADTWQPANRLTVNVGLRFDRFRIFLPEQEHPAGRFNPTAQSFPAVPNLIDWNLVAPRFGGAYQLTGDARTIFKGGYALYWLPPGGDLGFNANPNARSWWERFNWSDSNSSGLWEPDDQITLLERRGGAPLESLDPALERPYVHEATGRIERELAGSIRVQSSVVWRGERQQGARQRSSSAFEPAPIVVPDPGPDGLVGSTDDGPAIVLYDGVPEAGGPSGPTVRNVPDSDSDYLTWEAGAARHFSGRWSLTASLGRTWHRDQAAGYLGQPVRTNVYPLTPNDLINTDRKGRHIFAIWSSKIYGTYHAPFGLQVTPLLRHQQGQPFGRTFVADLPNEDVRVLAEPIGSRRQDDVTLLDLGVQRGVAFAGGRRAAVFLEIYNLLNGNAEQNLSWSSGRAFLRPLNIVAPRIARVGFKVDW